MSFPPPLDALLPPELRNIAASMFSAGSARRRMPSSHPSAASLRINESVSNIRLTMDLPGVRAKDVEVTVQHGVLLIKGCRVEKDLDGKICKKQKVAQRFSIDTHVVDVTKAVANLSHGVLVIQAPKKGRPVAVQIPVTDCDELVVDDDDDDDDDEETVPPTLRAQKATVTTNNEKTTPGKKDNNKESAVRRADQDEFENHIIHDTDSEQPTLSAAAEGSER